MSKCKCSNDALASRDGEHDRDDAIKADDAKRGISTLFPTTDEFFPFGYKSHAHTDRKLLGFAWSLRV